MVQAIDSWRMESTLMVEAHDIGCATSTKNALNELRTIGAIPSRQLRNMIICTISMEDDGRAKPGEALWQDLLEPHIYDDLKRNGQYVIGYITYRKHRNGEYSVMICNNRSTMFDVSEHLTEEFNNEWIPYFKSIK